MLPPLQLPSLNPFLNAPQLRYMHTYTRCEPPMGAFACMICEKPCPGIAPTGEVPDKDCGRDWHQKHRVQPDDACEQPDSPKTRWTLRQQQHITDETLAHSLVSCVQEFRRYCCWERTSIISQPCATMHAVHPATWPAPKKLLL